MTIYSNRITVGTAAVELVPPSTMTQEVSLLNASTSNIVRVGGPDVTTTAWGLPVVPSTENAARSFFNTTIQPGDSIWGITAAGTAPVNVWAVRKP
jgi:hypothetical protein